MNKNKQLLNKIQSALNNADIMMRDNKLLMRQYLKRYQKQVEIEEKLKFKKKVLQDAMEFLLTLGPAPDEAPIKNTGFNRDESIFTSDEE